MSDIQAAAAPAQTETLTLLDRIVHDGRMAHDDEQQQHARELLAEFALQVLDKNMTVSRDTVAMINDHIRKIDELISEQLNEVLHHADMQALEASWRGIHFLVKNSETGTRLKLRLLNVSKKDLQNDLEKAIDVDTSALFKKVYEEEYGTFGGHPFSVLVGDYYFSRQTPDISLLEKIASVAAAAHAPFISAAHPQLFDMGSFTELSVPRDLSKVFETIDMHRWREFRKSEDSRYVALVLPHILMRRPYHPDSNPVEGMSFVEDVDGTEHSKYLWGNAAYALSQRITQADDGPSAR